MKIYYVVPAKYFIYSLIALLIFNACTYETSSENKIEIIPSDTLKSLEYENFFNKKHRDNLKITLLQDSTYEKHREDTNLIDLQIELLNVKKPLKTNIEVSKFLLYTYRGELGDTIISTQSPDIWALAWINQPFLSESLELQAENTHNINLHLRLINKETLVTILDTILFSSGCCINSLDIKIIPGSNTLLYAFNDFSFSKRIKVTFGSIEVTRAGVKFIRKEIIPNEDKWDARNPLIHIDSNNVYLSHSTGDSWGANAVHLGKEGIQLYKVGPDYSLKPYKPLYDSLNMYNPVIIKNDSIFYRLLFNDRSKGILYKGKSLAELK